MAGTNGTAAGLRVARPTISVGGRDQPDLTESLAELLVVETAGGLYRCEARFSNWGTREGAIGFLHFDRARLDFGKPFVVSLAGSTLFDGRIMALEAQYPADEPAALNVLAEDRFQDLRMTRRTRTFVDVADADVCRTIASDHSLTADVDLPGPSHRVLAQVNLSDLAFLRERARALDAAVWVEGSTLHARAWANRPGSPVSLRRGAELRELTVAADLAMQRDRVTVSGWDVQGKSGLRAEATDSVIASELNGDVSGPSILTSALGRRAENLAHTVPLTAAEAQAYAEAHFRQRARRFVTGRGIAETSAALRVGATVELKGLGPLFSGKYAVSEVQHLFDSVHGLRTEFAVERPGLGRAS